MKNDYLPPNSVSFLVEIINGDTADKELQWT